MAKWDFWTDPAAVQGYLKAFNLELTVASKIVCTACSEKEMAALPNDI